MDASLGEMRLHDGAQTAVAIVFADGMHLQRARVEDETIVIDGRRNDLADRGVDGCFSGFAQPEKIEISCRSILFSDAHGEQHGSLEDELVPMLRPGQAVQETLGGVIHEREREVFAALLGQFEQKCPHRRGDVRRRRLSRHDIPSQ